MGGSLVDCSYRSSSTCWIINTYYNRVGVLHKNVSILLLCEIYKEKNSYSREVFDKRFEIISILNCKKSLIMYDFRNLYYKRYWYDPDAYEQVKPSYLNLNIKLIVFVIFKWPVQDIFARSISPELIFTSEPVCTTLLEVKKEKFF